MFSPDSSVTDTHINHEAIKLLSFYALIASLGPNNSLCTPDGSSSQSSKFNTSSSPNDTPTMRITVNASTNILGHGNTIHLPSQATTNECIKSFVEVAFRHLPDTITNPEDGDEEDPYTASPRPTNIEIKVNAGVNVCGSKNVVLLGGAAPKPAGSLQGQTLKRKAEGEAANMPGAKKTTMRP